MFQYNGISPTVAGVRQCRAIERNTGCYAAIPIARRIASRPSGRWHDVAPGFHDGLIVEERRVDGSSDGSPWRETSDGEAPSYRRTDGVHAGGSVVPATAIAPVEASALAVVDAADREGVTGDEVVSARGAGPTGVDHLRQGGTGRAVVGGIAGIVATTVCVPVDSFPTTGIFKMSTAKRKARRSVINPTQAAPFRYGACFRTSQPAGSFCPWVSLESTSGRSQGKL